jgi:hypothetical protein
MGQNDISQILPKIEKNIQKEPYYLYENLMPPSASAKNITSQ